MAMAAGISDDLLNEKMCQFGSVPAPPTDTTPPPPATSGSQLLHFLDEEDEDQVPDLKPKQDEDQVPDLKPKQDLTPKRRERGIEQMQRVQRVEQAEEEMEAELTEPKSTNSRLRRLYKLQLAEEDLRDFLKKHGFSKDIHEPRAPSAGCMMLPFFRKKKDREELYPVHVAAQQGDLSSLRLLLRRGADQTQKTSRGRSALDLACEADVAGSHAEVIHFLKSQVQFLRARDLTRLNAI